MRSDYQKKNIISFQKWLKDATDNNLLSAEIENNPQRILEMYLHTIENVISADEIPLLLIIEDAKRGKIYEEYEL